MEVRSWKGVRALLRPIIEIFDVSFSYVNYEEEEIKALDAVTLEVQKGEF
ncbi:MAG: hypothetical protein GX352_09345, partial [Clostridiales bacterium]|nr:hypothetical protein [Clostridiales bacterium]